MTTKTSTVTVALLFFLALSGYAQGSDLDADGEQAILYTVVKSGNPVDNGAYLMPLRAYKNLADCHAAKERMAGSRTSGVPDQGSLVCQAAKSPDERTLARMLLVQARN